MGVRWYPTVGLICISLTDEWQLTVHTRFLAFFLLCVCFQNVSHQHVVPRAFTQLSHPKTAAIDWGRPLSLPETIQKFPCTF